MPETSKEAEAPESEVSVLTGGFSQARTRIPEEAIAAMVDTLNETIIGSHPDPLWHGRNAVGEVGLSTEVIGRLPERSVIVADRGLGTFLCVLLMLELARL